MLDALGSNSGDLDRSSFCLSEDDTNNSSGKASSTGKRSQSVGSTTIFVFGSSKVKAPKLEKNSGTSKSKEAAIFDN